MSQGESGYILAEDGDKEDGFISGSGYKKGGLFQGGSYKFWEGKANFNAGIVHVDHSRFPLQD